MVLMFDQKVFLLDFVFQRIDSRIFPSPKVKKNIIVDSVAVMNIESHAMINCVNVNLIGISNEQNKHRLSSMPFLHSIINGKTKRKHS